MFISLTLEAFKRVHIMECCKGSVCLYDISAEAPASLVVFCLLQFSGNRWSLIYFCCSLQWSSGTWANPIKNVMPCNFFNWFKSVKNNIFKIISTSRTLCYKIVTRFRVYWFIQYSRSRCNYTSLYLYWLLNIGNCNVNFSSIKIFSNLGHF